MALVMTTGPAVEPVPAAEAKAYLRIDGAEDLLVNSLILTSRLHVEAALGLALVTQAWTLRLDRWPDGTVVEIPLRPVQSVSAVRVYAADGMAATLSTSGYGLDSAATPPRLFRKNGAWPTPGRAIGGVEIDFTAGYGDDAADVPAPIRQAILLLTAHWYEHRDPIEIGAAATSVPAALSDLLTPYLLKRL